VKTTGQTGVEMEALTAASVAGLTVYDMIKAVDKTMEIGVHKKQVHLYRWVVSVNPMILLMLFCF